MQRQVTVACLRSASPSPLMSHLFKMCCSFSDDSPGFQLGATWQSGGRSSPLSFLLHGDVLVGLPSSTCTRQCLAELLGRTQSTDLGWGDRDLCGQHLLLYTTRRCMVALKFFLSVGQLWFRSASLARKKMFLLQKKKEKEREKKVVIFKSHVLI